MKSRRHKKSRTPLTRQPKKAKRKVRSRSLISIQSVVTRQSPKKPRRVLQPKKRKRPHVKAQSKARNRAQASIRKNKIPRSHVRRVEKPRTQKRKTAPLTASRKTKFKEITLNRGMGRTVNIRKTAVLLNKRRSRKLTARIKKELERQAMKAYRGTGNYFAKLRITAKGRNRWISIKRRRLHSEKSFTSYVDDLLLTADAFIPGYLAGQATFQIQEMEIEYF